MSAGSDYVRHLAELRGIIEARDVRPGDVIMSRCPGDVTRNAHTVATAAPFPGGIVLAMDDGDVLMPTASMPLKLTERSHTRTIYAYVNMYIYIYIFFYCMNVTAYIQHSRQLSTPPNRLHLPKSNPPNTMYLYVVDRQTH